MSVNTSTERFLHKLPGRIRLDVNGLKGNESMMETLANGFTTVGGVHKIESSYRTGRALVHYDVNITSAENIIDFVVEFEQLMSGSTETEITFARPSPSFPLQYEITLGSLAAVALKTAVAGRSVLASRPVPFYLSGLVSIVSGFPFLRKRVNSDLLLNASSLVLAIVRENILVLSLLSLIQVLKREQRESGIETAKTVHISPKIHEYSNKVGKLGMIAAGITLGAARNIKRTTAVLLAANPRPAILASEYAWSKAELTACERQYAVPVNGSLSQLARTKTLIIEDTSLIYNEQFCEIQCFSSGPDQDSEPVLCLAASLIEKSAHPWRKDILQLAKKTCRTIRRAFHVEEQAQGIKGTINNHVILMGSLAYLQQQGIPCDTQTITEKRLQKKGFSVLFVATLEPNREPYLGLLLREAHSKSAYSTVLQDYAAEGWRIGFLRNSLNIGKAAMSQWNVDRSWLDLNVESAAARVDELKHAGDGVLFAVSPEPNETNQELMASGISCIAVQQLSPLRQTLEYVQSIDRKDDQHFSFTIRWNVVGTALAALGIISAPMICLMSDAISLLYLTRTRKHCARSGIPSTNLYMQEAAAGSEKNYWHAQSSVEVASHMGVSELNGLTTEQVALSREIYGLNQLELKKPTPFIVSYLAQFKEFTTLILLGTSLLALFTGGIFDGIAMGTILLANAAIGTIQERKAERVVETLNKFQPLECRVIRDGRQNVISAVELVPGDLVCLEAGDRIPADLRLVRSSNLQLIESALTGESLPVEKYNIPLPEDCPLAERTNMLYMGTDVSRGNGVGVVISTGMNTEMGHLMSLLKKEDKEVTPLQRKVTSISKAFIKGALVAGGLVFVSGLLRGIPLAQMVTTSITLAASAIPEGLPVTITIALSAGIFRMAKKNALIRKLSALETLGRTTVICTDKTGTLTKNEMTVKAIATIDRLWTVSGNGYEPVGTIDELVSEASAAKAGATAQAKRGIEPSIGNVPARNPELQRLLQIGLLCNNGKLLKHEGRWIINGDPTEGALLTLAAKAGMWPNAMDSWHRGAEVPFDSNTGKMSVVCRDKGSKQDCFVFSKGAPETIVRHCRWYQENGNIHELTEEYKQLIIQQNEKFAGEALRVLGFAYRPLGEEEDENRIGLDEQEMIYIGMAGMIDPPKPDVASNIREAFDLGVKSVMITGDHPITAIAIAKQLGIYDESTRVLSGHEIDRMTEEELYSIIDHVSIFARVTPEHKLRIVTALQQRGHIVAMTGDGVNDTPAIKQANIGIAMGQTGTEVTKQTAVMVLKQDQFESIVDGVKEGRTIISNIRKALGCLLTGNLAEILVTSIAVISGLPIPFVPIQILLMNLLTDALPAMILAVNPGNSTKQTKRMDIVDKELYNKVITKGILLGIGSLGLYAASIAAGVPVAAAQSVAFATLVSGQLIQTFSWRQEGSEETVREWTKDRFLIGALGISWISLIAALYVPPMAAFFHTTPLSLIQWIPILLVAGSISLIAKPLLALITRISAAPAAPASTVTAALASSVSARPASSALAIS